MGFDKTINVVHSKKSLPTDYTNYTDFITINNTFIISILVSFYRNVFYAILSSKNSKSLFIIALMHTLTSSIVWPVISVMNSGYTLFYQSK